MVKNVSIFFIVFSILMLSSCLSRVDSSVLPTSYVPTDDSGYIYGQFNLLPPEDDLLMIYFGDPSNFPDFYFGEYPSIGIIVENLDNSKQFSFILAEEKEDVIQMVAVPAGNYQIVSLEYLSYETTTKEAGFDMEGYQKDFVVEANTAVYIGDFSGSVGRDYDNILHWSLNPVVNNYDETAYALFGKYPFLRVAGIADVSHMK